MAALQGKVFALLLPLLLFVSGTNAQFFGPGQFQRFPFLDSPFFHNPFSEHSHAIFDAEGGPQHVIDPEQNQAVEAAKDRESAAGSADFLYGRSGVAAGAQPAADAKLAEEAAKPVGEAAKPAVPAVAAPQPDFPTKFTGAWEVVNKDAGVSCMHINLLPNNKIIMYDASAFHISNIKLPNGQCLPFKDDKGITQQDCWAHAVEYDANTNAVRPLKIVTDAWCSSGGLTADGKFISTGGWIEGTRSVRYFDGCDKCDFKDLPKVLAEPRWYATQITLADGRFILIGGRKSYSYEYVPPEGQVNKQAIFFPLLDETTDLDENNLYPFAHLSTDGNIFILANSRSVLLDPKANKVIREYPVLPGGSRNYPASGMSALLPIELSADKNPPVIPAEVIVCGGAKPEAYGLAAKKQFIPALQDCGRLVITDPKPQWIVEEMPSRRVMGDMLNLPTGDLLIVNGAQQGTSAWDFAEEPNFTPVLYTPQNQPGTRFKNLAPTTIARMYHSTSAVLPNGKILVAGSNTHAGYQFNQKYPTELRVEHFTPPYLDPVLATHRPAIVLKDSDNKLKYGKPFAVQFNLADKVTVADIKVTMYAPPFTTHGYSMNQRLLVLGKTELAEAGDGLYKITVVAPPSSALAPAGYYLIFVVHRGVPSVGEWVQIL